MDATRQTTHRSPRPTADERDQGSVLTMVLVFMVIGALILVPMLNYASTVLRVNGVAVQKRETIEQLRGGARVAAADPADLFLRCSGGSVSIPVAGSLVPGTSSTCRELSSVNVLNELEVSYGAVAMQLGETVPPGVSHTTAEPPIGGATDWYGDPTDSVSCNVGEWCPDPKADTIWLPPLPEVASSQQESTGYPMPAPRDCVVYFPGTYNDPILVDGPTYFVSGVYLFNQDVTVVGGADAVLGFGLAEGCVGNDVAAVLDMYPNPLPTDLNAEGNGVTLLLGDDARLIIDDSLAGDGSGNTVANSSSTPLRFEINQRYIKDVSDTAARVSIMTVNGDQDVVDPMAVPPTTTTGELNVPDVIRISESVVKDSTGALVLASTKGLVPSTLTAEPRPPEAPKNVVVEPFDEQNGAFAPAPDASNRGAFRVSWDAAVGNEEGGSTITKYEVTATPSLNATDPTPITCTTDGMTECIVRGTYHLGTDTGPVDYEISVVATNAEGDSEPSAPITDRTNAGTDVEDPGEPTGVTVGDPTAYEDAVEISWTPPAYDGNAPIVRYQVDAYRVYQNDVTLVDVVEPTPYASCETASFRDEPTPTSCVVTGLDPLDTSPGAGPVIDPVPPIPITSTWQGYIFEVTAFNAATNEGMPFTIPAPTWAGWIGKNTSSPTTTPEPIFTGAVYVAPPAPVWPVAAPYVPDPVVDVRLSGAATGSKVTVAGYIAVPQGRLGIDNPSGEQVALEGGVVAAGYDIDAATQATMGSPWSPTTLGFENVVLQRTVEIVTTIPGERITSVIRAQINANGADMSVNSWVIQ